MRNKKTIKEFRAFYIMASSVYAKSSRKRKSGVIVQFNKKHGRPSSEHPWEVIIPRITVIPEESLYEQKKLHLIIQKSCHVIVMVIARIIPVNAECEVFGIWLQLRAVVLRITLSSQMN